jgi:membrane-associated phospholipid phosphatase
MEFTILNAIQHLRTPIGDMLMPLISNGVYLWLILPVLLLLRKSTRRTGAILLFALVLDVLLCNLLLKNMFQRVRPCDVNTAITLLVPHPSDYSFPSGHSALSFTCASALLFAGVKKKWCILAFLAAALAAFSRLYLYVHYPTDVLAGILLGIFCGWAASRIFHALQERRGQKISGAS